MVKGKRPTAWEKEWARQTRREADYLRQNDKAREPGLNRLLADKVPPKLGSTLEAAFVKAFGLMFDKGAPALDRTVPREELEKQYQIDRFAAQVRGDRRSLRTFSRRAGKAGAVSLTLSGVEGVALGALGVGIPDIPIFTGVLLRSLREMAGCYGCGCDTPEEQYFQLKLIQGALASGEELRAWDGELNRFIRENSLPGGYDRRKQVEETARALSGQLLYMKFLQGIPLVGVVGGAYDAVCLGRVQRYAGLKYQRRLLLSQKGNL